MNIRNVLQSRLMSRKWYKIAEIIFKIQLFIGDHKALLITVYRCLGQIVQVAIILTNLITCAFYFLSLNQNIGYGLLYISDSKCNPCFEARNARGVSCLFEQI